MKKYVLIFILLCVGLTLYQANVFLDIKKVEPKNCSKVMGMQGPEDMVKIDQYLLLSASNLVENPHPWKQGGIFSYNTHNKSIKNLTLHINRKFNIHGLTAKENNNGIWSVYAINHSPLGDEVLIFDFKDNELIHKKTVASEEVYHLNDIELLSDDRFIVTKDHHYKNKYMKLLENFSRIGLSKLLYYDGHNFISLKPKFTFANGIVKISQDKVAVANMLKKKVHIFSTKQLPRLKEVETIDLDFFPDNLTYDKSNKELIVAGHYKILTLKNHASDPQKHVSPSKIISINQETKEKKVLLSQDISLYSGVSVAIKEANKLFIGYIYQNYILECSL